MHVCQCTHTYGYLDNESTTTIQTKLPHNFTLNYLFLFDIFYFYVHYLTTIVHSMFHSPLRLTTSIIFVYALAQWMGIGFFFTTLEAPPFSSTF